MDEMQGSREHALALLGGFGGGEMSYFYTKPAPSDPSDYEAKIAFAADLTGLMSKASHRLSDVLNEPIQLVHVFAHPVRILDKSANYIHSVRTVLIDMDGETYEMVSEGAIQGLNTIFQLFGSPDTWKRPVPVCAKQVDTRSGQRTFNLQVWVEPKSSKGKKK